MEKLPKVILNYNLKIFTFAKKVMSIKSERTKSLFNL
jgi:hypothetical protein